MTIWFSYLASPLGPSIRIKKAFFLGWHDEASEHLLEKISGIFSVENINSDCVEGKYIISFIDPDMNDIVEKKSLELVRIQ